MKFNNSNPADIGDVFSAVELVGELGPGSYSTVYAGICRVSRQARAVKVSKSGAQNDLRRFEAEYRILAHCDSPHVVRVYGFGHQPHPHILMQQIEGETLRQYVKRVGGLSVVECMQIGAQICLGLKALHGIGVIHRDLNLGNIIRGPDGHITLLDLGLAKRLPGFRGVVGSLTHPDLRIVTGDTKFGTPGFVPPEAHVTEKYDVYGLGGVLYALHARKVYERDPVALAEIEDDELRDLLAELLALDPQLRYSLADASDHIESIVVAKTGDVPECEELPETNPAPNRPCLRWLDLAGLAVAACAFGLLLFELGSSTVGGSSTSTEGRSSTAACANAFGSRTTIILVGELLALGALKQACIRKGLHPQGSFAGELKQWVKAPVQAHCGNGSCLWEPSGMVADTQNPDHVYVVGNGAGGAWLMKFDVNGQPVWPEAVELANGHASGVAYEAEFDRVFVSGWAEYEENDVEWSNSKMWIVQAGELVGQMEYESTYELQGQPRNAKNRAFGITLTETGRVLLVGQTQIPDPDTEVRLARGNLIEFDNFALVEKFHVPTWGDDLAQSSFSSVVSDTSGEAVAAGWYQSDDSPRVGYFISFNDELHPEGLFSAPDEPEGVNNAAAIHPEKHLIVVGVQEPAATAYAPTLWGSRYVSGAALSRAQDLALDRYGRIFLAGEKSVNGQLRATVELIRP
ncbi:MAG: serine/threonine-protein kinase [Nannocystaceae bacterium]